MIQSQSPTLEVKDLHKSFGNVEAIKGVSMTANNGHGVAILGASGSGKSTFLRCINLLEIPNSGDISIDGEVISMKIDRRGNNVPADIKQVERLRARLSMVFQGFNL